VGIHQARTALKLRKATEYPADAKDDSDLRLAQQPEARRTLIAGKKKPGNPHFRGPSGFSKPPKMVGRVGFEPTTNWLKANCSTN
jgi:hypothetical protein